MTQLSIFDEKTETPETSRLGPDFVRRHLLMLVRLAKAAEIMPWSEAETRKWEKLFPELALLLPENEGRVLQDTFTGELARLREAA